MRLVRCPSLALSLTLLLGCLPGPVPVPDGPAAVVPTALDEYIAKKDDSFSWKLETTQEGRGFKAYMLSMTSQTWRSTADVSAPVWRHQLTIVRPTELATSKAMLIVSGGDNDDKPRTKADDLLTTFATQTASVVVELRQVPNQPLVFGGDGKGRSEDDLIAYTWSKVIETGDPTWTARFPMVKSVVRAMDAAQAFLKDSAATTVDRFVVAGGSKRGWTTWLTGVVDPRVEAIVPLVIDVLNVDPSLRHHFAAYGFWAAATGDYVAHNIMARVDTAGFKDLLKIEDPYSYRGRLGLPKYVVNASGDQFFLPDSSQFYWNDLPGEKLLRYVPNADHSLSDTDAVQGVAAYFAAIVSGTPRPRYSWERVGADTLVVRSEDRPLMVNLWQAHNDKARDFRVDTIGKSWKSTVLTDEGGGVYRGKVAAPEKGFSAFFVELVYASGSLFPFKFTTEVRVVPDTLPFADRDPKTGMGEKP